MSTLGRVVVTPDVVSRDPPLVRIHPGLERVSIHHRYLSIDVLRAAAIILMVQVHYAEYLSGNFQSPQWLYEIADNLGLVPAPFFTFLFGLGYSLWLGAQKRAGRSTDEIVKYSFRRGMFVFVLGFAVNIFIWLPKQTFIWDILTLLGASALILTAARNWRPSTLIAFCVLILLATPPLRELSNYDSYWVGGKLYVYDFNLQEVVLGFVLNGYFPLLPWIVYPLIGFAFGQFFYPHDEEQEPSLPLSVPLVGTILLGLAFVGMVFEPHVPAWFARYYANDVPDDLFPATTVFVLGSLGFTILCLWFLNYALDLNPRITGNGPVLTFFRRYSYFALTTYVVHLAVCVWPLWIAATWGQKTSVQFYVGSAASTPVALGLALAFIVLFYPCLFLLERYQKYSLEHLMRRFCE